MRFLLCFLLASLAVVLAGCVHTHPAPQSPALAPLRVLFIGNSLTYTNDLPGMLQKMAAAEPAPLHCTSVVFPGVSLDFHLHAGAAHKQLLGHAWEYVVLQDYSTRPLDHPEATTASVRAFLNDIRVAHAVGLLFENWPRRNRWNAAGVLWSHYRQIHAETGIPLVPIGDAWQLARGRLPWFQPYTDDRHPTRMGTYLAACVLFESIYHHPASTAYVPQTLSPEQAGALVHIANETER